jgi:hypothetical protein
MFKLRIRSPKKSQKESKNIEPAHYNETTLSVPQTDISNNASDIQSFGEGFRASSYKLKQMSSLILNEKWDEVRLKLKSSHGKDWTRVVDESGLCLLGMLLGSQAPKDIVELIILLNPGSIYCRDKFGALPLHIGCLNGISSEVVQMIINIDNGYSARVVDEDNRTALHHAVELSCILSCKTEDSTQISLLYEESINIIEILLSIAPENVHVMSTKSGDTPLDIPQKFILRRKDMQESQIYEIYRLLKETSVALYLMNKRRWEEGFADSKETVHSKSMSSTTVSDESSSQMCR